MKLCSCGRSIPQRLNSTIQSSTCPSCTYKAAIGKKIGKKENKPPNGLKTARKPPIKWRDKKTADMIIHVQERICNPYIRERDQTCLGKSISDNGQISDAGHFYSVGAKPGMRFNPQNIHGQSASGNRFKGSDALKYRKGLIIRHGEEFVKELEYQAMMSEGCKNLDRINVILIAETYLYLMKNKIWVFRLSEFDKYKIQLINTIGNEKK